MENAKKEEAKIWLDLLSHLQRRPTEIWTEDAFKVFNLINRYKPEKIFGKVIEGIPVVVVVHSTKRGTALGGTRILPYRDMANALRDCLKLSSAMTYKAVWSRLPLGGGKAVIWSSPSEITESFLVNYAEFLNEINAASSPKVLFATGEDIGFSEKFADVVSKYSSHIAGKSIDAGGLGDPSPKTAKGIFLTVKAMVENGDIFSDGMRGKICAVQGAGKVALPLMALLLQEGCEVYFSENDGDPDAEKRAEKAAELGAQRVNKEVFYGTRCHIIMPCAIGGVMNKSTIPLLSPMCRIVIGAANNILDTPEDGEELHRKRIFYCPDYVVNRYGLEWVFQENRGVTDWKTAESNLTDIKSDIRKIYRISREKGIAPSEIADLISKKVLTEESPSIENALEELLTD
ncbi:MAG: Glu/Leu/Phe/Val dehydrogenase dimerization domain-containing protein [bacterium]|nr:Glu/Leu/Phe/Val dehydrogenase dimerization domain-containing protein [bacterium]